MTDLTLDIARKISDAALAKCRDMKLKPMAVVVLAIGIYPNILLDPIQASVATLVQNFAQMQPLRIGAMFTTP